MTSIIPYRVLVVDDEKRDASWGDITKTRLEDSGKFQADHVYTIQEAMSALKDVPYDIFVIDLNLQSRENGADLHRQLRAAGLRQPIVLVTGNKEFLDRPLSFYRSILSQGPVEFYDKTDTERDIIEIVNEVSNRVDPVRRAFNLMSRAGLGGKRFYISDREYTVDQLLAHSMTTDDLLSALRESLYALVLESRGTNSVGRKSDRSEEPKPQKGAKTKEIEIE